MKDNGSSFRQGLPESKAIDSNLSLVQLLDSGHAVGHNLPSMAAEFWHSKPK